VEILSSSSTDSGAALLLDMADDQAARILATCPREVAGQLIQGMAASHPQTAGSILQIFTARLAAQVLRHMNHGAAAAILTTMPVMEATRILNEAAPRIAAMAIGELPRDFAAQVLKVLDEPRAGEVLGHVTPSHVAILLAAVPPDLSARLLARLSPAFRALVRQRM
jgi:flagellar motor switch protein FliG